MDSPPTPKVLSFFLIPAPSRIDPIPVPTPDFMEYTQVRAYLEEREESLSPFATKSRMSRGRKVEEEPSPLRTDFQRDRDRILHTNAFRRLKHKTQVFIAPLGDHYVTRLTHTLEVSQIGRTIARALNLNEDLVEAMCLGHDLGHAPFGHIGEDVLASLYPGGFRHSHQSLRVVDRLENGGKGDVVRVQNVDSGKTIEAVVVGREQVVVSAGGSVAVN